MPVSFNILRYILEMMIKVQLGLIFFVRVKYSMLR